MGEFKTLKQIVIESGLTHQQIADRLGVKQPRISAILNGSDLKVSTAIKLSAVFNISLKTLAASLGQDVSSVPDDDRGGDEK
jgi:transcriptional regulator with XRE-family HTH domain